jgi:hypothetical protein
MPYSPLARWLPALAATVILFPTAGAGQDKPKRDRDVISRQELVDADSKFPDLSQAISRLRPHFLAPNRGPRTTGVTPGAPGAPMCNETLNRDCSVRQGGYTAVSVVIYLDGTKAGDADVLRGIRTGDVEEVRYLNPNKAASEYGLGHEGGVILVKRYVATKP